MDPMKPAGNCPVDLSLGPIQEAAHSLRVGDAEYKDAWTAQQMHEERERCYALGVAAERERCAKVCESVLGTRKGWEDLTIAEECAARIRGA